MSQTEQSENQPMGLRRIKKGWTYSSLLTWVVTLTWSDPLITVNRIGLTVLLNNTPCFLFYKELSYSCGLFFSDLQICSKKECMVFFWHSRGESYLMCMCGILESITTTFLLWKKLFENQSSFKLFVIWQEKANVEKAAKTQDLNFIKVVEGA